MQWFALAEHKDDAAWLKHCMKMETERTQHRGCPRKTWQDCVKGETEGFGLNCEYVQDRNRWRLKIKGGLAVPGLPEQWPLKFAWIKSEKPHLTSASATQSQCIYRVVQKNGTRFIFAITSVNVHRF